MIIFYIVAYLKSKYEVFKLLISNCCDLLFQIFNIFGMLTVCCWQIEHDFCVKFIFEINLLQSSTKQKKFLGIFIRSCRSLKVCVYKKIFFIFREPVG